MNTEKPFDNINIRWHFWEDSGVGGTENQPTILIYMVKFALSQMEIMKWLCFQELLC